jgi:hypothetical protein
MTDHRAEATQIHPWYRYPWPWVAIAIPAVAVVGGLLTLYLAVSNPDPLVVDEHRYEKLRAELLADPSGATTAGKPERAPGAANDEGDRDD